MVWLRFLKLRTYPWSTLVIAAWKLMQSKKRKTDREKTQILIAIAHIDHLSIYAFLDDLPWWFL